jgi:nucleobase transporter 1/2
MPAAVIEPSSRLQSNRHSSSAIITSSTPVNPRSSRGGNNLFSQSLAHLQNQQHQQNNDNSVSVSTTLAKVPVKAAGLSSSPSSNHPIDETNDQPNDNEVNETPKRQSNLILGLRDNPHVLLSFLLGLQQYITMLGGTVTYPYILTSKLCMRDTDPARGYIIATTLFCSGVASFLQTTFGIRLPVIQGATFTFLVPTLAILSLPSWSCPTDFQVIAGRERNSTFRHLSRVSEEEYTEVWQSRMREIQGAIIVSSCVEVFLGLTGIMGLLLRFITPLSIVPTISLIGLSLFKEATAPAGESWVISGLTIVMIIVLSQYLVNCAFTLPFWSTEKGFSWKKVNVIKMFPVGFR